MQLPNGVDLPISKEGLDTAMAVVAFRGYRQPTLGPLSVEPDGWIEAQIYRLREERRIQREGWVRAGDQVPVPTGAAIQFKEDAGQLSFAFFSPDEEPGGRGEILTTRVLSRAKIDKMRRRGKYKIKILAQPNKEH